MALKANQKINSQTTRYVTSTGAGYSPLMSGSTSSTIFAGSAVILAATQPGVPSGQGSGQAVNDQALVAMAYVGAPASGTKFLGVSHSEVKNYDLTKVPRSVLRPTEQVVGEPILIGNDVEVWTDRVTGIPVPQGDLFLAADSTFGVAAVNGNPVIGKWLTGKDAGGFAMISVKVA